MIEPTPEMIEAAAQRLVRWEDGCTWPDSWDALTVAAARQDAERALEAGLAAFPGAPQMENLKSDLQLERYRRQKAAEALQVAEDAIDEALAAYARGKPVDEIMRGLKAVQRDTV